MSARDELTKQEKVVLSLVVQGWQNAKIAQALYLSPRTVEAHLYHIFDKLGVSSRTEATVYAFHTGLLARPESSGNTSGRSVTTTTIRS